MVTTIVTMFPMVNTCYVFCTGNGGRVGEAGVVHLTMQWVPVFQDLTKIQTLDCDLRVKGVGVSLIDGDPKELMYISLSDIHLKYHTVPFGGGGGGGGGGGTTNEDGHQQNIELKIMNVQIDNQLLDAHYNVMFSPSEAERMNNANNARPVVHCSIVQAPSPSKDLVCYDMMVKSNLPSNFTLYRGTV